MIIVTEKATPLTKNGLMRVPSFFQPIVAAGTNNSATEYDEVPALSLKNAFQLSKAKTTNNENIYVRSNRSSLQDYFDSLLLQRGYRNVETHYALSTAYYQKPTETQIASYGPKVVEIAKANDVTAFKDVLSVTGLSPNPCNSFGESLAHMACRRGLPDILRVMVENGAVLQTCDDYGRTPLHDACWAAQPDFDVVKQLVLECDRGMWFMKDLRGALPLSYVHRDNEQVWKDWLDRHIDLMFPSNDVGRTLQSLSPLKNKDGDLDVLQYHHPSIQKLEPVSLELVAMVAKGILSPREALVLSEIANRADEDMTVAETINSCGGFLDEFLENDEEGDDDYYFHDDVSSLGSMESEEEDDDDYFDSYQDYLISLEGEMAEFVERIRMG